MENFANRAETTLNGAITNVAISLVVTSAATFPTVAPFRIRIESEYIIVGAVAGTTFSSLTRGAEGTVAAAHTTGVAVIHPLTRAGLFNSQGVFDVRAYAGIQAAMDAAGVAGGGVVRLPIGTYNLGTTGLVFNYDNVELQGQGENTIIDYNGATFALGYSSTSVVRARVGASNLKIDSNGQTAGDAILLKGVQKSVFRDIFIDTSSAAAVAGIKLEGTAAAPTTYNIIESASIKVAAGKAPVTIADKTYVYGNRFPFLNIEGGAGTNDKENIFYGVDPGTAVVGRGIGPSVVPTYDPLSTPTRDGEIQIDTGSGKLMYWASGGWRIVGGRALPQFVAIIADRTDAPGAVISIDAKALDAETAALTYSAVNLPLGLTINTSTGLISGTIAANASGTYATKVIVDDNSDGTTQQAFTWTVSGTPPPTQTYAAMIAARSGLVAGYFFDLDAGTAANDIGPNNLDGTSSTTRTTLASPLAGDSAAASNFASDTVTIAHNALFNWGDGPFSIEFWYNDPTTTQEWLRKSDGALDAGWKVSMNTSLLRLQDGNGTNNVRQTTSVAAGWHHVALTRATAASGEVYIDGALNSTTSANFTFVNNANDITISPTGGIYGLALYNKRLSAAEALESATFVPGGGGGGPADDYEGYGANATGGAGQPTFTVTTLSPTGPGSIMDALSQGNRNIVFSVSGTIDFGQTTRYVTGTSNWTLNGGGNITIIGASLYIRSGASNFIVKNIRHRGGWLGSLQDGDCFTVVGCDNFVFSHVSAKGHTDEGISFTTCTNWTRQDCLIGSGVDIDHSYGSLNNTGPGTDLRTTYIKLVYRQPQMASGRIDIVNPVIWGYENPTFTTYGLSIFGDTKANCINAWIAGIDSAVTKASTASLYHTGTVLTDTPAMPASIATAHPTDAFATYTTMTALAAKNYAKTNAGCLPHDATDIAFLANLPA